MQEDSTMASQIDKPLETSNYPGGLSNRLEQETLGKWINLDPTTTYTWFDDFFGYTADNWTVTAVGSGSVATTNTAGGVLLVTNAAADNDHYYFQWAGTGSGGTKETFKFVRGKRAAFKCRVAVNEVIQSDFLMGLYVTDTDPIGGIVDGVYFRKDDGSAVCSLVVNKDSTATTTTATTMVAATYVTLGFVYDGNNTVNIFVDENRVASSVATNLPDDEELALSFVIQQGEATNVKTLSVDYIYVSFER
jgi:hypothetical protein